jgi:ABC-type nitrate/sulfonate/bicarbonate transport system permease component
VTDLRESGRRPLVRAVIGLLVGVAAGILAGLLTPREQRLADSPLHAAPEPVDPIA